MLRIDLLNEMSHVNYCMMDAFGNLFKQEFVGCMECLDVAKMTIERIQEELKGNSMKDIEENLK